MGMFGPNQVFELICLCFSGDLTALFRDGHLVETTSESFVFCPSALNAFFHGASKDRTFIIFANSDIA
ncbi:MAG: hypothetical protein HQ501_03640 [Rhodospirillales bacterium]|nr:hypothetical protein [Rhodospirillales bacterium]